MRPVPLAALLGAAVLGAGLLAPTPAGADADHPTNAAAVFKWGTAAWGDEFHSPEPLPRWQINKPQRAANQHGMLTLESARNGRGGTITALATDQSAKEGRWEARVRARRYTTTGTAYEAVWELVPVNKYRCGAKSIVLAAYRPDDAEARGAVRTPPDREYTYALPLDLGKDVFHTYAVEVTADHVSWFVDTQVIHTERRPEALSGVELRPRLRLQAAPGVVMDHTRMQLDWVRYYTMARPNQRSIEAPPMQEGTYAGTCASGSGSEVGDQPAG